MMPQTTTYLSGRISLPAICGLGLLLLTTGCGNLPQGRFGQESVKIAVLPSYGSAAMSQKFLPLLERISRETGYDVQYISSESVSGFGAAVENSGAQLAFCDALTFLTLQKTKNAVLLAAGRGTGETFYTAGLIVVPLNGPTELAGLKGKVVCCASRRLADGFLSPAMTLFGSGIDPMRDVRFLSVGQLDRVIPALERGLGQAGFIPRQLWNDSLATSYRVLAEGRPVPYWLLVSLQGGHTEADEKIQGALLGLDSAKPDDLRLLSGLGLTGFNGDLKIDMGTLSAMADSLGIPY